MPRLPELQEMDNKQLNESLSQFSTEGPSKKDEEYSKSSPISFFSELTCERNCLVNSFTDILPICNDFKGSSQNGRRFHFHSRFEPIREFVHVRRKSMFTFVVDEDIKFFRLIQFIKELKKMKLLVLLKKQKRIVFYLQGES